MGRSALIIKPTILLLIVVAVLALVLWSAPSMETLSAWSLDSLYCALDIATVGVVIGVVIEELSFFRKIWKFSVMSTTLGYKPALRAAWSQRKFIVESLGFVLLVISLIIELRLQAPIRFVESAIQEADRAVSASARKEAAEAKEMTPENRARAMARAAAEHEKERTAERAKRPFRLPPADGGTDATAP